MAGPLTPPTPPERPAARFPPRVLWLGLLAVALVELVGHAVIVARVPPRDDWRRAADRVREGFREGDLIVSAPDWTDPVLRRVLGDRIDFGQAGRSDTAPFERLWVLSIRGHDAPEAPAVEPALDEHLGRVRLRRWDLDPSPVVYHFVEEVRNARVTLVTGGTKRACPWRSAGMARGGGLGAGAMTPSGRFACDGARPWLWVGPTVTEDLELEPRWCIWQHPAGREPVRTTFEDVPLGDRMVLHGGLYYEHERMREHGPIHVSVRVDGEHVGRMTHRDGDGWKRIEVDPRAWPGAPTDPEARGDVTIEVTAPEPHLRTFCWSATIRRGPRRDPRGGAR